MKDVAAVIAPEITEAEIVNRWDLATGREERAEKTLAESRLEKGRILVEARKMYPARGPRAKGWGDLLRRLRVDEDAALRYMRLAGHVDDEISRNVRETSDPIPTYAEAGIVKQPVGYQSSAAWEREHRDDRLIEQAPRTIVAPVVSETWADDMEGLAEQMIRSARSLFSAAEQLDALCRQREVSISSAKFASIPTHLLAAQASIASTLRIFKGELP